MATIHTYGITVKFQLPPQSIEVDGQDFDLDRIRCFRGPFDQLLQQVSTVFTLPDSYCEKRSDGNWYLCTGSWASLEEVFAAMKHVPLFWIGCWVSSNRDGSHVFTTADTETVTDGQMDVTLSANESVEPLDRAKLLSDLESLSTSQLNLLVEHSKYELP